MVWIAVLALFIVGVILLGWRCPHLVFGLLVVGNVALLARWHTRADIAAYLFAVLFGVLGEWLATAHGYWVYAPEARVGGLPIPHWLFLVWGYLLTIFRRIGLAVFALTGGEAPGRVGRWRTVVCRGLLAVAVVYFIWLCLPIHASAAGLAPFGPSPASTARLTPLVAAGIGIFMGALFFRWRTDRDLAVFAAAGVCGWLAEYLCVGIGIWSYPIQAPLHLPWLADTDRAVKTAASLPLAWGLVTVIAMRFGAAMARLNWGRASPR